MLRIKLFALLSLCWLACQHQPSVSRLAMCHADFAAFADDPAFRQAHPTPQPVALLHGGRPVTFPLDDSTTGRGFLALAHRQTNQFLLLFHEWWGLNDHIRNEAIRWAHDLNIHVLAIDLYDGRVAATADEARQLMQGCLPERAERIIRGAAAFLGEQADFRTLGWCFGGGWSLKAALLLGERAKGCVVYYGMPERDAERLKALRTDVLFVHAKRDRWITDEVVASFADSMRAASKTLHLREYDADHAFANPTGQRYHEPSAQEARAATLEYLRKTL
ncbi:MAG: dienelactone hydrolase family protein [Saprospiraceae bacterium]|nr:dienelactone hydrolase family protein [Saprospiraceae bacterium]MDW8228478.1 dienelactone hydrolase family protein [Saprospiraceae bacterium]